MPHLLQLRLPTHEFCQPPFRCHLQTRSQRPEPGHLVDCNRFAYALDLRGARRLEREIRDSLELDLMAPGHR